MDKLAVTPQFPPMSHEAISLVQELETLSKQKEQVAIKTYHLIHGGIYSRTILIPANVRLTGALIKIPTTLIINGHAFVFVGDSIKEFIGYHVLPASAGRKQVFITKEDTYLTMQFPTSAKTVEDAEKEFTDETDLLFSHDGENKVVITEE